MRSVFCVPIFVRPARRLTVTVQLENGQLQSFHDYGSRVTGDHPFAVATRKAATCCHEKGVEGRDTRHDINVFPPTALVVGMVAEAIAGSTYGER